VWFVSAMLEKARLYQADLRNAVFWEASLPGAGLRAADLSGVDFSGAVLGDASLDLADLRGLTSAPQTSRAPVSGEP